MDETGNPAGHSGQAVAAHMGVAIRMLDAGRSREQIQYFGRLLENCMSSGVPHETQEAARRDYRAIFDEAAKLPPAPPVDTVGLLALARSLDAKADPNAVPRSPLGTGSWGKFSELDTKG